MIPKVIHYCWFGGNSLPNLAVKCIESWKKYCPDYEIIEWNENNYDIECCDYVREAYKAQKWAFVSDYARFDILYRYGGIYFDTDVELIKPIDDIVSKGAFMGLENDVRTEHPNVAPGLGLAANPGLGLYKDILESYQNRHFIKPDGEYDQLTVVKFVTDILVKNGLKSTAGIQCINDIYIYPKEYFCPYDYKMGFTNITDNTRSVHHYTASWQSEDEKKNTQIFMKMKQIFGPVLGKGIGYICTINLRRKIRKSRNAIRKKTS